MNTVNSQSLFLKRPYRSQHKPPTNSNIFVQTQNQSQKNFHRHQASLPKIYDFIGPPQLRAQIIQSHLKQSNVATESLEQLEQKQKLGQMSRSMQTTIKQETVLSKFTGCQMKEYTRQLRNMQYYKEYQNKWNKITDKIKQHIPKGKQPTLLQRSKKHLVVLPNPQKEQILKNFVTSYWEKSLRNNDKSLTKHLKGHNRYNQHQLEEMMQRDDGLKQIQSSMPRLPVQQLNKLSNRELVLSGRNKLASESMSCDPSIASQFTSRRSRAMTDLPPITNSQIWRIEYDSSHKYIKDMQNY